MSTASVPNPPDLTQADAATIMDFFRTYLQQVVTLHMAMFQKLLFDEEGGVPLELAELFEDASNTYIRISESISKHHLQQTASEVKEQLDAHVEPALRRVKPQLGAKPRVRRAKHLAQPVKD
jgi:hypothetical protein